MELLRKLSLVVRASHIVVNGGHFFFHVKTNLLFYVIRISSETDYHLLYHFFCSPVIFTISSFINCSDWRQIFFSILSFSFPQSYLVCLQLFFFVVSYFNLAVGT